MAAIVLVADGKETRHELGDAPVVVGRADDCDIQVTDGRASRQHFRLEPTERGWVLRDLDSSNGTTVNGYGVSRVLLTPGDVVELGALDFRFESGASPGTARAARPARKIPSRGPAWAAALAAFLALCVATDVLAVESARTRERDWREALEKAAHARFLVATRTADPDEAEALCRAYLLAHPTGEDAPRARARIQAIQDGREVRKGAAADFERLAAAVPGLTAPEFRWRLESLVRRWSDSAEALSEIGRRLPGLKGPAAPPEDSRAIFQRRKREADAAIDRGELGKALSVWSAHALESPPSDPDAEADLRADVRRIEALADARAAEVLATWSRLRDAGDIDGARNALKEGAEVLSPAGGGRRLAARLEASSGQAQGTSGAAAGAGRAEGNKRKWDLLRSATDAEQFVALRDYLGASRMYAGVAAGAGEFPEVKQELEGRAASLRRVGDLLEAVRTAPGGWKGKPWPDSWDQVEAGDLWPALQKAAKKPEDRLALATFAWDQLPRKQALDAVCAALENEATHAEAERFYASRAGIPIPEGGFVVEKGEILTRAEWNRRRNAEAIARLRERQAGLVRRLHESQVARGIDRIRELRGRLDRARAHALELIFDETLYFYPYRDRMGEYTPVQAEVDRRVDAVREIWGDKTRFRSRPDSGATQLLRDFDEAAKQLRSLGAEPGGPEKEVAALRRYLDRDLDVRGFFLDEGEIAQWEYDAGVMRENAKGRGAAEEPERRQVEVTNEYRRMFGRRALLLADKLVLSARAHGDDMSRGGFFNHFNQRLLNMKPGEKVPPQACGCSSDGLVPGCGHGPDARIRRQGYEFIACSENIHAGSGDPESAHRGWCHSSGHHRNILAAEWKEMGTGQVGKYWTQNFGLPPGVEGPSEGAGSAPWDRAGGRGTGEDGNPPDGR
jgi:uncharacterized protein YkwD